MLLQVTAAVSLVLAAWAWVRGRRLARKLDALTQSYWELRYDFTRLRSQVARLDPESTPAETPPPQPAAAAQGVTFVSLSSMKKKG